MSKLFWDAQVPWLRLNGSGARQFLQGQTSADLNALQSGDLLQTCWLTATGRLWPCWNFVSMQRGPM